MDTQLTTEDIQRHFPQFTEPGLQQVMANEGRLHYFEEGDVIMDYGGYVRMLPLILEGAIKISRLSDDGTEVLLYYLTRGESCTMTFSCCLHSKKSEIRAVAEEVTTIFALPHQRLDQWMMNYKSWKNYVMLAYDDRMNELIHTIDQLTFHALDERLLEYLQKRAALHADGTVRTTHQQVADDLHVSREAVSRLLKSFEQKGVVGLGRNRVRVN